MRPRKILPDATVARAAERIRTNGEGITAVAGALGISRNALRGNFGRFEEYADLAKPGFRLERKPKEPEPEPLSGWDAQRSNQMLRIPLRA